MLKNYFKTVWRNLKKNKIFSAINILGLSVGIAAFLLIVNYLRFQYSFDEFHQKKARIYRVPMKVSEKDGEPQTFAFTYPAVAPAMKKDFPEVEDAVRIRIRWGVVQHEDQRIVENGQIFYVDPAFFRVFSFPFEKGDRASAFAQLNNAVITHSTAIKYFGNENPIGKKLRYEGEDYVITGVLKDVPPNSHINFHILLNFEKYIQITNGKANNSWGWSDFYTYVLLKPGTNVEALRARMDEFAERYKGADMKKDNYRCSFQLQPLTDIHIKSEYNYEFAGSGNLYYLKYLGIAALFILLIALINYINLSTAHSLERSREVGVRKVIGAGKFQLVRQFLTETFFVNLIGIALGIILYKLLLSPFAQLAQSKAGDVQSTSSSFWIFLIAGLLLSTLLAGVYPAFILSSFQPVATLKSMAGFRSRKKSSTFLRKSLVALQFVAAIILIGSAIGFYRQMQFMSHSKLGIDINQTLVMQQTLNLDSSKTRDVEALINELGKIPGVEYVTASSEIPGNEVGNSTGFRLINSNDDKRCRTFGIDETFIPHFGLQLAAGRNFDKDVPVRIEDTSQLYSVIINETAAKTFGFPNPAEAISQKITGAGATFQIVGVINDYHQQSLQNSYDPIIYYPEQHVNMTNFSLKLHTARLDQVVERAKKTWAEIFPTSPMQFFFLDEYFNRQYQNDQLFSTILWWFTVLSIIIASLGLMGLSLYAVAKRTKEIGVRKVLGASVFQITTLITKDYMQLILIASVIAIPTAFLLLQRWLSGYAFHIRIGLWFFVLPVILISAIALLTVLYQALKAAMANPIRSLRSE